MECGKKAPTCWCAELPALPAPDAAETCLCRKCLEQELARRGKAEKR